MASRDDERLPSRRVARLLRAEIERGERYTAGSKLPSYRQLAEEHGVAVNTAASAVQLLANEGLVSIRAASGVYIREPDADSPAVDVRGELADIRERLQRSRSELDSAEEALANLLDRYPATGESG